MTVGQMILNRLDQIDRRQEEERRVSSDSRSKMYARMEEMHVNLLQMDHRLKNVEDRVSSYGPTITEYITMKERVRGAGMAGRFLWGAGGVILSVAAFLAGVPQMIGAWFRGL